MIPRPELWLSRDLSCGYPFHHNEYACLWKRYRTSKADAILAESLTGREYDAAINEGLVFGGIGLGIWQTEVKAESGIDGILDFRENQIMGGVIETCQYGMNVWCFCPSTVVGNEQGHRLRLRFHRSHFCGLYSFGDLCANGDFIKINSFRNKKDCLRVDSYFSDALTFIADM